MRVHCFFCEVPSLDPLKVELYSVQLVYCSYKACSVPEQCATLSVYIKCHCNFINKA